ncbi:MAG: amino acid-binding protein [Oscillospiraceae bacterium]|jgi:chorismate mutase
MEKRTYLLVDAAVLPEVFLRVLKAKELLAGGEAKNISRATRMAEVSRSAYYKYKDCVFRTDSARQVATLAATLLDKTGALQALVSGISQVGAGVVTINQSMPENGTAKVAVTIRTEGMQVELDELCAALKKQKTVVDVRQSK